MSLMLFANDGGIDPNIVWLIVVCVALVVLLVFLFIFFSFVQLWIQSLLTGAGIGIVRPGRHEAAEASITA